MLVTTLLEVPWVLVMAVFTLVPAAFGISGFAWTQFWPICLAMAGLLWALECFAQLVSLLPGVLGAIVREQASIPARAWFASRRCLLLLLLPAASADVAQPP